MHPLYGFGPAHSLIFFMFFGFFGFVISIVVLIPWWFIFKRPATALSRAADVRSPRQPNHVVFSGLRPLECRSRGMVYPAPRPFPISRGMGYICG